MFCQFVPNELLKAVDDKHSLKISERLRARRNKIRKLLGKLFSSSAPSLLTALKGRQRSTYDCENGTKLRKVLEYTESSAVIDSDRVLNAAHINAGIVYDFLLRHFKHNSLDNRGFPLISNVHYDKDLDNAFFDGDEMIYGDGGKLFLPLALALDVDAHEFLHGVTQFGPDLVYKGQSGAINESFSDRIGIAIQHEKRGESDPNSANWFLASDILTDYFKKEMKAKGLRSFTDEPAYKGEDNPRHMKQAPRIYPWSPDSGFVHSLSTIPNVAYRLICIGMSEPSYGKPAQIAWQGHFKLRSNSKFKDLAKADMQAARELYGEDIVKIVEAAYKAVGILK